MARESAKVQRLSQRHGRGVAAGVGTEKTEGE